jgi:7-cyano-7-deazaguanine synthase in queuosine biosynthesis
MDEKKPSAGPPQQLAAVQKILQKIARLSPGETRQLTAYLAHGATHDAQVGTRMQNAVIQASTARTLVMLSGGLDSVAMLYLLLKHAQGLPLHVHHVKLYGWESETKPLAESMAIRAITDYLWEQGYRFEYSESAVRYDYSAFDQTIYYFQAACLAASMPRVTTVAVGRVKEDIPNIENTPFRVHPTTTGHAVFRSVLSQWPLQERSAEVVYPLEKYAKKDLPTLLPRELLELVCSCRQPIIVDDSHWEKCGKCSKCRAERRG